MISAINGPREEVIGFSAPRCAGKALCRHGAPSRWRRVDFLTALSLYLADGQDVPRALTSAACRAARHYLSIALRGSWMVKGKVGDLASQVSYESKPCLGRRILCRALVDS